MSLTKTPPPRPSPRCRVAPPHGGDGRKRPFRKTILVGLALVLVAALVCGFSFWKLPGVVATIGLLLVGLAFVGWLAVRTVQRQALPESIACEKGDEESFHQLADAMPQIVW